MIKISIVHPSFGRPQQAFNISREWMECADNPEQIEYLIGLDDNDSSVEAYKDLFNQPSKFGRVEVNIGDSRCSLAAMNRLGTIMSDTAQLILGGADDQAPCKHWDTELFKLLVGVDPFTTIKFIGVSDGLRDYGIALLYLIVTRAWYTKFGYFLCPEYDGFFADNEMHEVAKRLNVIIDAPYLLFQHRHYLIGMNTFDATYARTNNQASSDRNLQVYNIRAARNFDL